MNQEKLYHLFEKSSDAIVIFDTSYGIQYANPSALHLLSYENKQLSYQPFSGLFSSAFQAELDMFISSTQKSIHISQKQVRGHQQDSFTADIGIQRISRLHKIPAVYLATLYPKNKKIKAEREETQQHIQAETRQLLNLLKDETDMPLNTLSTLVDRLLNMHPRTDQLPLLHNMQHSGQRLQKAIEHILLYDDLIHERMSPDPQPFSVLEVVEAIEKAFNTYPQTQRLKLKYEADTVLPLFLMGDMQLICKALIIILEALIEAATEKNNGIKLQITYNKSDEDAEKFNFVFNAELDKNIFDKAALGIGVVNHIASLIGANWYVNTHSARQKELCFTVPLTIIGNAQANNQKQGEVFSFDQPQDQSVLHGLRLLYVEDIIANHFLMEGLCSIWQVHLDTALNGREALDRLHHHHYDIVLMDLKMPVMDGYMTTQIIRQAGSLFNASVPIIALSGSFSDETIEQIKQYGMNDYILKPIKPDELYQKLLSFVST
ncbi:response regulator [Catalinimonas sp. 4WD22]|uniref:ATP-binding response regulator n=1 Tax=Catalinimonas locisalis TaxID=3133978 RepID=UPI003100B64C